MHALLLVLLLLVAGCGAAVERVHGANSNAVIADLQRIEEALPAEEAAGFAKAYRVLLGVTVVEHQDDWNELQRAIRRRFNGKSAAEIVAEYEGLPAEVRGQFAADEEEGPADAQGTEAKEEALE